MLFNGALASSQGDCAAAAVGIGLLPVAADTVSHAVNT